LIGLSLCCCLLFIVCCLLFVVCCLLFVVCCLLFVVCCCLLFVVCCCLLFVVCCLLFVVVVCCWIFIVELMLKTEKELGRRNWNQRDITQQMENDEKKVFHVKVIFPYFEEWNKETKRQRATKKKRYKGT